VVPFIISRNTGCPTRYRTQHFFNNFTVSQQLCAPKTRTTDTFLFISRTTNVPLFKFRCNVFIGVRIIKEMPGSLASGTPYIFRGLFVRIVVKANGFAGTKIFLLLVYQQVRNWSFCWVHGMFSSCIQIITYITVFNKITVLRWHLINSCRID
jgi:hypothetical protein